MQGGKRQGAGRKKGFAAKTAEEARRVFAEVVARDIEPIAEALSKKAVRGDIRAAQLLFDRAWGKAPSTDTLTIQRGPKQAIITYVVPKNPEE